MVMNQERKVSPRISFGAGYPADVHADIPADVRGSKKLRSEKLRAEFSFPNEEL